MYSYRHYGLVVKLYKIYKAYVVSEKREQHRHIEEYQVVLNELIVDGWDDFIGCKYELPDEYLPEAYLKRREERVKELEYLLGDIAAEYRGNVNDDEIKADIVNRYDLVLRKLFFIGHWSFVPDHDASLPDEVMPQFYKDYWKERQSKEC